MLFVMQLGGPCNAVAIVVNMMNFHDPWLYQGEDFVPKPIKTCITLVWLGLGNTPNPTRKKFIRSYDLSPEMCIDRSACSDLKYC